MKKSALLVALLGVLASPLASAADLGTINVGNTATFSGTIGDATPDVFTFSLPGTSSISGFGTSFAFDFGTFSLVPKAFTFTLDGNALSLTDVSTTAKAFQTVLAGGSHTLTVGGEAGAFFGGGIKNVAAVPEPESYAMLLAGLGIMGAVARRRRSRG